MITIPISEVRKFISAANPIKDTKMLPIYAYVKLVCDGNQGVFYKTNGSSFVVCHVKAEFDKNESLLIEEKALFGFVHNSAGKEIKITKKENSVTLNDGKRVASASTHPVEHFSAIQEKTNEESIVLTEQVLNALFLAKAHVFQPSEVSMRPPSSFVHMANVGKSFYVAAWNGQIAYLKKLDYRLPVVSLDPETISIISKLSIVNYSRCGKYDYFDGGGVAYGFIQNECKTPDISKIVENFKHTETFTVDRKSIVGFCKLVTDVANLSIPPVISIWQENGVMVMDFQDYSDPDKKAHEDAPLLNGGISLEKPFWFQPKNMITILEDLGVDNITLSYVQNNFLISSDEEPGYIGAIMELSNVKS